MSMLASRALYWYIRGRSHITAIIRGGEGFQMLMVDYKGGGGGGGGVLSLIT